MKGLYEPRSKILRVATVIAIERIDFNPPSPPGCQHQPKRILSKLPKARMVPYRRLTSAPFQVSAPLLPDNRPRLSARVNGISWPWQLEFYMPIIGRINYV